MCVHYKMYVNDPSDSIRCVSRDFCSFSFTVFVGLGGKKMTARETSKYDFIILASYVEKTVIKISSKASDTIPADLL